MRGTSAHIKPGFAREGHNPSIAITGYKDKHCTANYMKEMMHTGESLVKFSIKATRQRTVNFRHITMQVLCGDLEHVRFPERGA